MKAVINGQKFGFADRNLFVSKSVGIYECEFVFDETWVGWNKTAVFEGSGETIEVVIVDDKAQVPWEVIKDNGLLKIGVYGTLDEKIRPTIWSEQATVKLGTPTGATGTEPTPTIYAQILEVAQDARNTAQEAYSRAVTAQDSAEASARNSEAWAIGQKNGQDVPQSDPTYHNNSKYWCGLSEQNAAQSGYMFFYIDSNGDLIYQHTTNVVVDFYLNDGDLYVRGAS